MSKPTVTDTALYDTAAADIYAAFQAMPNSSAIADNWNSIQAGEFAFGDLIALGNGETGLAADEIAPLLGDQGGEVIRATKA